MNALAELQDLMHVIESASMFDSSVALLVQRGLVLIDQVQQDHRAELALAHASAFRRASQDRPLQDWASLARQLEDVLQGLEAVAGRIEDAANLASKTVPIATEAAPVLEGAV